MNLRRVGRATREPDLRRNRARYPDCAACIHPKCHNLCTYRYNGRGQQSLFCSDSCRRDYGDHRRALNAEVDNLRRAMADVHAAGHRPLELEKQLTHALWHLARYGGPIEKEHVTQAAQAAAAG